jgi:hypothetical protein
MVVMMAAYVHADWPNMDAHTGLRGGRRQEASYKDARNNAFHLIPVSWT